MEHSMKSKARMKVLKDMKKKSKDKKYKDSGVDENLKKMKGMKKVTIASNSEEGLEHGLNKAKQIMDAKLGESDQEDDIESNDARKYKYKDGGYKMSDVEGNTGESTEEDMKRKKKYKKTM